MNTREQFGKYLLLKKLTEDALGETFRAGMLGQGGMERVVLLRVFNGQGVDGARLWQATQGRVEIPRQLRNPNIGDGVEMGELQGLPYVAYDYISGKNMADLLEQAAKSRNYIPAEHALLITERVALALAAASESRLKGERILHGFVTPHLVMISNEGEARLLGFEIGPGLRTFAANPVIRQHFGRYLAPEALGGQPPHAADDIYSLGVVLYELLTGRPLPPPAAEGFGPIIDQGIVATEGTPIPAEIQDLLKRSLVAREQRISDVSTWHKSLNKIMFDGQYNPTTFNLAFFMHNLFRQDIEQESQELEIEKTLPLPTVQPASAPETQPIPTLESSGVHEASATETGVRDATGVREVTGVSEPPPPAQEKKSSAGLLAAIAVIAVLGAGGGLWWWSQKGNSEQVASQPAAPPPPVLEPEPAPPAGTSEEELSAKIDELISQRTEAIGEELSTRYNQEIADLQKQLDQARNEAEARRQRELELEAQKAREEEEARLAQELAEQKAAEEVAAKKAEEEAAKAAAEAPPPEEVAPPPPPPPPPPPKPQVRRGDLVEMGPGVVGPVLVRRPELRFPEQARRLNRTQANVTIKVLIDENGKVAKAELVGERQGWGFDAEALNAVKRSLYKPATKNGVPVKMWHTLEIEFRR